MRLTAADWGRPSLALRGILALLCCCPACRGGAAPAPAGEDAYPADEAWQACWIWGPEKSHGALGCFRKEIEVGEGLRSAWAQLSGDDAYTLFVNGREARRGGFWWKTTNRADLLPLLHPGRNLLAARVQNAAHPGALLLQLDLVYGDGRHQVVVTDTSWRFSAKEPADGWVQAGFDDGAWERSVSEGRPPEAGPWGEMPLCYLGPRFPVKLVRAAFPRRIQAGRTLELSLTLQADRQPPSGTPLLVSLEGPGRPPARLTVPVGAAWEPGKEVTLPAVRLPIGAYVPGGRYRLAAGLRHSRFTDPAIAGFSLGEVQVVPRKPPARFTDARVRAFNGAPTLFLNGQARFALWFFQSPPLAQDVSAFHKAGVDVVTCGVGMGWAGPGRHDFTETDDAILRVLDANPDGYVVPRVSVGAPGWWLDAHPEESVRMADGTAWVDNGWGGTKHESFASERWRREAGEALRALIEHIAASPYSDRVIGYHVANGIYGEWHAWSATNYPDNGEPMRRAFAAHVRRKYHEDPDALRRAWGDPAASFEGIACPTVPERQAADLGVFRDPARSCRIADYYEAFHQAAAESIEGLCRVVKEVSAGKALTLVFYGYWPDLAWPQEGDHRALARVASSPYVDSFSSPHSYSRRALGEDGLFRAYPAALQLAGKLFLDEGDDRTHLANDPAFTHVKNSAESVAIIRREFANALTHNVGLWYMDQQGNWFRDPAVLAEIARARRWGERSLRLPRRRTAQVAVFLAPEGHFHLAGRSSGRDHVTEDLCVGQIGELARSGAPFDVYLAGALGDPRLPEYDCYVMLECFALPDDVREAIRRKAMRAGKTVLWFYAPGFVTEQGLSVEALSALTGIRMATDPGGRPLRLTVRPGSHPALTGVREPMTFGAPAVQSPAFRCDDPEATPLGWYEEGGAVGLAVKQVEGCRSVYCGAPLLPAAVLRGLFRQAGVHLYLETGDPLTANESFVAVHTATAGPKRVSLPQPRPVYDVTAERAVSPRPVSEFTVDLPAHETRIYYLGVP